MKRLRWLIAQFDRYDVPSVVVLFGIALMGYGASRFHVGLGFITVGLMLVLYVEPLCTWWRK